ncbi:MAG: dihydrofolate reductase family protein [Cyclobacteriaceae bacterium]|nr:dihydrofolate reductase family protein [Cyclobacteriaceae bacterium]
MATLSSFTFITLDGYYKGLSQDTSWHHHDKEGEKYSEESLASDSTLLFGRTTYEMMASFWPTPMASEMFPKVAKGMNKAKKLVISSSLQSPQWKNTEVLNKNWLDEIAQLKKKTNITLLGSGSILTQLANAGFVDQFQFMIDPVAIGEGTPIFKGLTHQLNLQLVHSRVFKSGTLLLTYKK